MNTQEAKFILQAYRPNGEDASDPQFAEALAQAKLDPELGKWFAEQVAFDAAATRALKEVKAPQHLRESILAGKRVIEPTLWWKQPVWLAMAAAFVIVLGIAGFWIKSERDWTQFANYRKEMAQVAHADGQHVELETPDPAKIRERLASEGIDANYVLRAGLSAAASAGCRVVAWNGNKAFMICLWLQGTNHLDLFVAERRDFKGAVPGDQPQFAMTEDSPTASWSHLDKVYVLVGHGAANQDFLRKHLDAQSVAGVKAGNFVISACLSLAVVERQDAKCGGFKGQIFLLDFPGINARVPSLTDEEPTGDEFMDVCVARRF